MAATKAVSAVVAVTEAAPAATKVLEGDETDGDGDAVAGAGGTAVSAAARRKPGAARGRTGSRSTVREQAKKAQEDRERDEAELKRAMEAAADIPEPERQHLVAEGSVSDKRRSLAGAIPMGMFGGPPPRRPSVASSDEAGARAPVAAHAGPQFGMGLTDVSSQLGSLRKRAPSAAATAATTAEVEADKPAVVKPSEMRAAALSAKKQEPQLIKAMMRDTLADLESAQARTSMSDLSELAARDQERGAQPKSPRLQELDGLIDEARQAVATPVAPEVLPPAIVVPEQAPHKTNLEAVSPYNSSPSESPRQEMIDAKTAVVVAPAESLFVHLRYEDMPSPQASRNSMHVVEVGDEEDDDSTSEE